LDIHLNKNLMTRFKPFILLLLYGSFTVKVLAQKNPYKEVSIASPTAGSLGKYADIPVNNHTGIPQISIPIYSVKEGPLQLPISLSYHASGLKVEEPASWVGAGWSLDAGGVITRTVQGAPDERQTSSVDNQTHGYYSDYGYNNYMWVPGSNPASGIDSIMTWHPFADGVKDGEPDLFFFNFAGYSGKFFFSDDRTLVLLPEQDIKIEANYPGTGSIKSFTITTPDGTKYYFGRTDDPNDVDPIEKTKTYSTINGLSFGDVISSWYLNKITSSDNNFTINLKYSAENYGYFTNAKFSSVTYTPSDPGNIPNNAPEEYVDYQQITVTDVSSGITLTYYNIIGSSWSASPHPSLGLNFGSIREYALIKNMVDGVRLNRISFSNGTIDFIPGSLRTDLCASLPYSINDDPNTEAKTLGSVQVSNSDGTVCSKFNFNYSYFEDNSTALQGLYAGYNINSDKKRLKLESVQQSSCSASATVPPYTFTYFNEAVPRRLSFAQDHWGFNNGAANTALMPGYTVNKFLDVPGANRQPKWPEMRAGSLQKINYPTGGFTEFEFEPHKTWVSSPQYTPQFAFTMSMGYDGGYIPIEQYVTLTSNPYKINLINAPCPYGGQSCTAALSIYNSNNELVETVFADRTLTTTKIIQLPASTYRMMLFKDKGSATGDVGCTVNAYEMLTSTNSRNEMVGGLRIKSITNNNAVTSNNTVTNFSYETNGQATSVLYGRPTYVQVVRNDILKNIGTYNTVSCSPNGCVSCDIGNSVTYVQNPGTTRPMGTTQGAHIGYNEVKVSQTGNGHSIYRYYGSQYWDNIHDDIAYRNVDIKTPCNPNSPNYPSAPLPTEFMRGELKYEGHFNETGQVLKETDYVPLYTDNPSTTPCFIGERTPGAALAQIGTFYELKTAKKVQTEITERNLVPGSGYMVNTKTVYYESPFHNQPSREVSVNSLGQAVESKMKYVADYRIPACDAISNGVQDYINNANSLLGQFYTQSNSQCGTANCRWIAYQYYMHNLSIARRAYVENRKNNFTNAVNNFKTNHDNAKATADADLKPILELQDQFQNLPVEITSWKSNQLTGAGFSKYDFESGSTSKVYMNKFFSINLAAPSSTFAVSSNTSSTLSKDIRYTEEGSYVFKNGNPSESKKKDDITNAFIWDYKNNQPIAQVVNAAQSNIAYNSFESDGTGNWIYAGSIITDASAPTGRKVYSLNSTYPVWKPQLDVSKTFIVSYWSKNGAYNVNNISPSTGRTFNGWTYYEHIVPNPASGTITISGTGLLDEARLYPKGSMMTSYTYEAVLGITTQCDPNNKLLYYEYDGLGRLILIRDQDKNIVKKICYNFAGQTTTCNIWYNVEASQSFTRNNCPPGYTGSSVSYSVPASIYASAISQADADARAQSDLLINGQTYANAVGTCTPPGCTYTNCEWTVPNKHCVNGVCETGWKVFTGSYFDVSIHKWICTYHWEWSDGAWSQDYTEPHDQQWECNVS
jgi:YD repeat-containing protein